MNTTQSRGLRNNNPGNIRLSAGRPWLGEVRPSGDPCFCRFSSMAWGFRAMFQLLDNYGRRHGLRTVRTMIGRWAPPSENDTAAYVRYVSDCAEIGPDTPVDTRDRSVMRAIVGAMARMENGADTDLSAMDEGWELYMSHLSGGER